MNLWLIIIGAMLVAVIVWIIGLLLGRNTVHCAEVPQCPALTSGAVVGSDGKVYPCAQTGNYYVRNGTCSSQITTSEMVPPAFLSAASMIEQLAPSLPCPGQTTPAYIKNLRVGWRLYSNVTKGPLKIMLQSTNTGAWVTYYLYQGGTKNGAQTGWFSSDSPVQVGYPDSSGAPVFQDGSTLNPIYLNCNQITITGVSQFGGITLKPFKHGFNNLKEYVVIYDPNTTDGSISDESTDLDYYYVPYANIGASS